MVFSTQRHSFLSLENILLILLLLPVILFIAAWFRLSVALLGIAGLLLVLRRTLISQSGESAARELRSVDWCLILLAAVCWVSLSGTGGIGFQNWDHEKHNAVMNDLVRKDWPARYDALRLYLVYYLPYYLIPAAMGKAAGWTAANLLLWLQLLLFVILILVWLVRKVEPRDRCGVLAAVLLFIFFSGCDWVGVAYGKGPPEFAMHLEWWNRFNYLSITSQLFWTPNAALASWAGTALFLDALKHRLLLRSTLVWLLTFFWCPYAAVGLLLFLLYPGLSRDGWNSFLRKEWKWTIGLIPAAVLAVTYYASKSSSIPFDALWMRSSNIRAFVIDYIKFLGLHVLWAIPLLWYFRSKIGIRDELWRLFLIACGFLIVLPLAIAPGVTDFIMKASMPSILVFAITLITVILRYFQTPHVSPGLNSRSRLAMAAMIAIYLLGSLTAVYEIGRSVLWYRAKPPAFNHEDSVPMLKPDYVPPQYMSEGNSLLRMLLRNSGKAAPN